MPDRLETLRAVTRAVARGITPPVLLHLGRMLRRVVAGHPGLGACRQYSTLDDPVEVPQQVESYLYCRETYVRADDCVLDVGFGLGYGLHIMAAKARAVAGVEIDERAVARARRVFAAHPVVRPPMLCDGLRLPFDDGAFDVVTCVEVIEHVEDYETVLRELARVSKRCVFITTPSRRPETTLPDGRPKNHWHLREWTPSQLDTILRSLELTVEWRFLNGDGPFRWSGKPENDTVSLVPVLLKDGSQRRTGG